jgi:hypothetical protein
MNEQTIGEVAGEVWRYLDRNGGRADLNTLRNGVKGRDGVSPDLGTGWLAREGKVYFAFEHGSVQVGIRR